MKTDVVVTSAVNTLPKCNVSVHIIDIECQTLMFSIFKLQTYMEQNMTKVLILAHPYGMPINMLSIFPLLDAHEKRFGFRPVIIEDRTMSNGSSLVDISSFIQLYSTNAKDFGWIVWPNEWTQPSETVSMQFGSVLLELLEWPSQQAKTIENYKHLQNGIEKSLLKHDVTDMYLVREAHTTLTVCSLRLPLLTCNANTTHKLQKFMQANGVECQSQAWGIAISCGYMLETSDIDHIIQCFDDYVKH